MVLLLLLFSTKQKREISNAIQEVLRNTNHPELPHREIQFDIHIKGAENWSYAHITNNGSCVKPSVNEWNEY